MLIAFQVFNNIIAHRLLTTCYGILLYYYHHQTINNFEKLLKQKNAKNISKMAISILLTISIYIGLARLLKVGPLNIKYDLEEKLCKECISTDWRNDNKIKEVMVVDNNKNNNNKDHQKKNR